MFARHSRTGDQALGSVGRTFGPDAIRGSFVPGSGTSGIGTCVTRYPGSGMAVLVIAIITSRAGCTWPGALYGQYYAPLP